jgi:hypothetical protein
MFVSMKDVTGGWLRPPDESGGYRMTDGIACFSQYPNKPYPAPNTLHPIPYTQYPTPNTLHPIPYTQYPTPNTLHPIPYTQQKGKITPVAIAQLAIEHNCGCGSDFFSELSKNFKDAFT